MKLVEAENFEILYYALEFENLLDISENQLCNLLNDNGVILFRNFDINESIFSEFIKKTTKRVTVDPARKDTTHNTQLVDAGYEALGLHVENGNTPFLPHTIWFFCKKAAHSGSETTYCDGRLVWSLLSNQTRDIFLKNKIKYQRKVEENLWKRYVAAELNLPLTEVGFSSIEKIQNSMPELDVKLNNDQSIQMFYITSAVHTTYFSNELAFANSLLGPSYNYETPVITFEDDSEIPPFIWQELKQVTESVTRNILWQDKDIAVIDNTRIMHGRRKILDTSRKIHAAMSYWN